MVLTHMRPRLAGDVVRGLLEREGLAPERVVVVVNGPGGLDDPALADRVRMVRLPRNTGPAGGFRAGLVEAFADPATRWAYLCEDDVGLFDLPSPRLSDVVARADDLSGRRRRSAPSWPTGAASSVVAGTPSTSCRRRGSPARFGRVDGLSPVDVACWGATLVSRAVVEAGVLPDPDGSSASRTSTSSAGCARRASRCSWTR